MSNVLKFTYEADTYFHTKKTPKTLDLKIKHSFTDWNVCFSWFSECYYISFMVEHSYSSLKKQCNEINSFILFSLYGLFGLSFYFNKTKFVREFKAFSCWFEQIKACLAMFNHSQLK